METPRQKENTNKSDELNDIIRNLCDWMTSTNFIVREISFFSKGSNAFARINVGKYVNGKMIALSHEFILVDAWSSQAWDKYKNNFALEGMLAELRNSKLES